MRQWVVGLLVTVLLASSAIAQTTKPTTVPSTRPAEIDALIKQLGDDDWQKRDDAKDQLIATGPPALPQLRAALAQTTDLEIQSSLQPLIDRIEHDDPSLPTLITLHLRHAAPLQVFQEMETQSGEKINYNQDIARNEGGRTVTIEVDRQPFWPVMMDVCRQLGLRVDESLGRRESGISFQNASTKTPTALPQCYKDEVLFVATGVQRHHQISYEVGAQRMTDYMISVKTMVDPKLRVQRGPGMFLKLSEATDELGHSLIQNESSYSYDLCDPNHKPGRWQSNLGLAYRPDQGKVLKTVKGIAPFEIVRATETWTCDLTGPFPQARKIGRGTYTIKDWKKEGARNCEVHLTVDFPQSIFGRSGGEGDYFSFTSMITLLDSQGKAYVSDGGGGGGSSTHKEYRLDFSPQDWEKPPGLPAKLVLEVPTKLETIHVPFEFHDLPLP